MAGDERHQQGSEQRGPVGRVVDNIRQDAQVEEVSSAKYEDPLRRAEAPEEAKAEAQEAELGESWPLVGTGIMTDGMWKGFLFGSVVGGLIGAVVLVPVAFFVAQDLALWIRLVLFGVIGALAGGTAGAMYFGGRVPELEGEVVDGDERPSAGTTLRDPHTDARGNEPRRSA